MFLHQCHLESLGHASYVIGDEGTGQALVLDPQRDVRAYFEVARDHGSRIAYVIDSHGHNDYLSGISEIAARAPGLSVLASAEGSFGYDHRAVKDGEIVEMGDVAFEVMHTPGHTPEHVSLLVRDRAVGDDPAALLSGGALLVGDVARPDLLGGAAQTRDSASAMCEMLQTKILELPDHVEVFPTHVSGSLCGATIGARLSTTIGYERRTNPMLRRITSEDIFVRECLDLQDLPAVPPYWKRMRPQNLSGPALLDVLAEPPALDVEQVGRLQAAGAVVLDTRQPESFAGGHVPGALNVGLGSSFSTWTGTVVPEGADVVLVLDRPDDLWEATWQLLRIGYRITGRVARRRARGLAHVGAPDRDPRPAVGARGPRPGSRRRSHAPRCAPAGGVARRSRRAGDLPHRSGAASTDRGGSVRPPGRRGLWQRFPVVGRGEPARRQRT